MKKKYYLVNADYQPLTWDLDRGYCNPIIEFDTYEDAKIFLDFLQKYPTNIEKLFIKKTNFEGMTKNLSGYRPKSIYGNEITLERWEN